MEYLARYRSDLGHIRTVVIEAPDEKKLRMLLSQRKNSRSWRNFTLLWVKPLHNFVQDEARPIDRELAQSLRRIGEP